MIPSIELFLGPRSILAPLFAEADDSASQIQTYIELGHILVARRARRIIAHLQLIPDGSIWEIKSLAVVEKERGRGVGSALVRAALQKAFSGPALVVVVATAAADTANLRFYQRLGFRLDRIEHDAYTAAGGYSDTVIDGIPLRDRVWLSIQPDSRDSCKSALKSDCDLE